MDKKIPDGVVLTAAYALSKEWNLHYPDAVRMAALVLSVGQQHPEWQPVEDGPIDANSNAEYIEHCADVLEQRGLRVTAGALRVIAQEHRTLSQQHAAERVDVRKLVALAEQWERYADGCRPYGFIKEAELLEYCAQCIRQTLGISAIAEALSAEGEQAAAVCTCPHQDAREPYHDVACPARPAQQPATSTLVGAEDIEVLKRLRAALPDVGLNGWWLGVEVLNRVIDALDTKHKEPTT